MDRYLVTVVEKITRVYVGHGNSPEEAHEDVLRKRDEKCLRAIDVDVDYDDVLVTEDF